MNGELVVSVFLFAGALLIAVLGVNVVMSHVYDSAPTPSVVIEGGFRE